MTLSDKAFLIFIKLDLKPRAHAVHQILAQSNRKSLTSKTIAKHMGEPECFALLHDMKDLGLLEMEKGLPGGDYHWKLA